MHLRSGLKRGEKASLAGAVVSALCLSAPFDRQCTSAQQHVGSGGPERPRGLPFRDQSARPGSSAVRPFAVADLALHIDEAPMRKCLGRHPATMVTRTLRRVVEEFRQGPVRVCGTGLRRKQRQPEAARELFCAYAYSLADERSPWRRMHAPAKVGKTWSEFWDWVSRFSPLSWFQRGCPGSSKHRVRVAEQEDCGGHAAAHRGIRKRAVI